MVRHLLVFAVSLALASPTFADECLKSVFNEYCLGGQIASVLTTKKPVADFDKHGKRIIAFGSIGDSHMLEVFDDRIMSIAHVRTAGGFGAYASLRSQLEKLYGAPKDMTRKPSYVDDADSMETAVRIGRATVLLDWPQSGWSVRLLWTKSQLTVRYVHTQLTDAYHAANPNPDGL